MNSVSRITLWFLQLSLSVTATYRRDGAPFEYVMSLKAPGAILALPEAPRTASAG